LALVVPVELISALRYSNTPTLRSSEIEDEDDDENENEMTAELLIYASNSSYEPPRIQCFSGIKLLLYALHQSQGVAGIPPDFDFRNFG